MNTKELRQRTRELPPIEKFDHQWQRHRKSMRYHILNEPPQKLTRWSTIQATMYAGQTKYLKPRLEAISRPRYSGRYLNVVMNSPKTGAPEFLDNEKNICPNYVHQAHHIMRLETMLSLEVQNLKTIAEFGGGYGALCKIVRRLGFDGGYHIYDFPELLLVQEYYLSKVKAHAQFHSEPDFREVDLLIAISSLSEAPVHVRQEFLAKVKAKFYFIRFQKTFFDIDNMMWFTKWASRNLDKDRWSTYHTRDTTHFILAGVAR